MEEKLRDRILLETFLSRDFFSSFLFFPCLIFLFLDPFDGSRADRIGEFRPTRLVSGAEHELPSANTKRQMQKNMDVIQTNIYQQIWIRQNNYKHTKE